MRSPASANADERAQRTEIAVGLIALVLEGTFAILFLAVVAFITSAFLTSRDVSAGPSCSLGLGDRSGVRSGSPEVEIAGRIGLSPVAPNASAKRRLQS